jgi:hypothetical protein
MYEVFGPLACISGVLWKMSGTATFYCVRARVYRVDDRYKQR